MTFFIYSFKTAYMVECDGSIVAFDSCNEAIGYAVRTAQAADSLYTIHYHRP